MPYNEAKEKIINNTTPLFSVLIAQYNNGQYLQEAINSVKNQTYTNWEIILVDDASTDISKELYKIYESDNRIKIFFNEENKGCGYTKRRCVELANGEICGFLDPDDAIKPDALSLMVAEHIKDENISLIYSRFITCDEYLNEKHINTNSRNDPNNINLLNYSGEVISHFVSFKKFLYMKTDGINPDFKRAVDQDLYLKLEEVGSLEFIDKPFYLYRIHKNGISTNNNIFKAFYWHIKAVENACQRRGIAERTEDVINLMINVYIPQSEDPKKKYNDFINKITIKQILKIIYTYLKNKIKYILNSNNRK